MNEATLEAKVHQVLENIFPTFKQVGVTHQVSFSVKFGHRNLTVNNKPPGHYNKAVADVLLTIADKPVILLEIKADGHKITQEDIDQGISYGRLVAQIPPITAISNSTDTRLFNTFTKDRLDESEVDESLIAKILAQGLKVAAADVRSAVETLMGSDPRFFAQVAKQITQGHLQHQLGPVQDLLKAVSPDFQLQRNLVDLIFHQNSIGRPVIAIRGGAFSGKTNLLYQLFKRAESQSGFYVLYWDCNEATFGIFQKLANELSSTLSYSIDREKVRAWFITIKQRDPNTRLFFCFDNLDFDTNNGIVAEVTELISLFQGTSNTVVYTVDDYKYEKIAYVDDRPYKTALGEGGVLLDLDMLDDQEYQAAMRTLRENFQIVIARGGAHSALYRQPRILRLLTAEIVRGARDDGSITLLDAVPDDRILTALKSNKLFVPKNIERYRNFCLAVLADMKSHHKTPEVSIISHGTGMIRFATYNNLFKKEYKKLAQTGLVGKRTYGGVEYVVPRVPELLSGCAVDVIYDRMNSCFRNENFKEVADILLKLSAYFPYSEIVGCQVLRKIGSSGEWEFFSGVVSSLLERPPIGQPVSSADVMLFEQAIGTVTASVSAGEDDGRMFDSPLPYLILSHLAKTPLGLIDPGDHDELAFWHTLLYTLASTDAPLFPIENGRFIGQQGLQMWEIRGVGSFISQEEGVIEPIVQSLSEAILHKHDSVERLYERALAEENLIAMWRIQLANEAARPVLSTLGSPWPKWLDDRFYDEFSTLLELKLTDLAEDVDGKQAASPVQTPSWMTKATGLQGDIGDDVDSSKE